MSSSRRAAASLATCLLALVALLPAAAHAAAPAAPPAPARVVATQRIDDRLLELTVTTSALAAPTKVRVLLPAGYASTTRRRYPVLYLLHGASGSYRNWTDVGGAERTTADQPLIVVMPDGGRGGWYSDWYNGSADGPPRWETYHIGQLLPLIDGRFRTLASPRGRAIAGLSMGGFGALSYAARHPDLFTYAGSFSGGVDLNANVGGLAAGEIAVDATATQDGGRPGSIFGDFVTQNIRWRGHNPPDLAVNLRGLGLALYTGNGQAGGPFGGPTLDVIEFGAHEMNVRLNARLNRLAIPHLWDDYGSGAHTWPYWSRDLREMLPLLRERFASPPAAPARVTYTSTERSYSVYGWSVSLRRPNVEFSTLLRADRRGFALRGSGRATVTTPPRYRPRRLYRVRIRRDGFRVTRTIAADRTGHLRLELRLAPANRYDQDSPQAKAHATWHRATATVSITRAR